MSMIMLAKEDWQTQFVWEGSTWFNTFQLSSLTLSAGSLWVVAWKRCCASSAVAAEAPGHGQHGQHGQNLQRMLKRCFSKLLPYQLVLPPQTKGLNTRQLKNVLISRTLVTKPWKPAPDVSAQKDGQFTIHCMALSSPSLSSKSQTVNSFGDIVVVVILWPETKLHLSHHAFQLATIAARVLWASGLSLHVPTLSFSSTPISYQQHIEYLQLILLGWLFQTHSKTCIHTNIEDSTHLLFLYLNGGSQATCHPTAGLGIQLQVCRWSITSWTISACTVWTRFVQRVTTSRKGP